MKFDLSTMLEVAIWAVVLSAVGWALWQVKKRTGSVPLNFLLAVLVLTAAAMGLNGATQYMQLHFKKQPVTIAVPLKEISSKLGPWMQVSKDEPLEGDVEAALGTKEYIFRDYVNVDLADPVLLKRLDEPIKDKKTGEMRPLTSNERHMLLYQIIKVRPDAVVNLAVTYYTGLVDTVAHIPDRCYIADGYEPSEYTTETWATSPHPSEVRFINFEDQSGNGKLSRCVAYFFRVNDMYTSDPVGTPMHPGVRMRLQDLREKYGFYSKVELMMTTKDRAVAAATMTSFLSYALPEIEKCYPDWKKVTAPASPAVATAGAVARK